MTWTEESIAEHPCDVFEPTQPTKHNYVVIYLHGVHLQRLTGQASFEAAFEKHGLRCIAPITQRSWWVDRICPEFDPECSGERHVRERAMEFIQQRWGAESPRIALLGTSMGGQGALRLSYKYPDQFPVAAAISPAVDFYLRMVWQSDADDPLWQMYEDPEQARQDSAILHIHPLYWPRNQFFCCDPADSKWWDSVDRLKMKLDSLGVPSEADLETTGGGHSFEYYNRMAERAIDFIAQRLDQERLRVV